MQLHGMQRPQSHTRRWICVPLWLWRDQLERRRLIVVVAWPSRDEGRAHASSMAGHLAQLRRLARGPAGWMDTGRRRLAGSRYMFAGGSKKDDAGGGVASRCLGCLVVWKHLVAYR